MTYLWHENYPKLNCHYQIFKRFHCLLLYKSHLPLNMGFVSIPFIPLVKYSFYKPKNVWIAHQKSLDIRHGIVFIPFHCHFAGVTPFHGDCRHIMTCPILLPHYTWMYEFNVNNTNIETRVSWNKLMCTFASSWLIESFSLCLKITLENVTDVSDFLCLKITSWHNYGNSFTKF